jgi:hypothetical protein
VYGLQVIVPETLWARAEAAGLRETEPDDWHMLLPGPGAAELAIQITEGHRERENE